MDAAKDLADLRVFKLAMEAAMLIFNLSKAWPEHERYGLTAQIINASRSVCANLAEAWRKRAYKAWFIAKLTESAGEASETRVWLTFAHRCGYMTKEKFEKVDDMYNHINAQVTLMIDGADTWCGPSKAPGSMRES